MKQNKKSKKKKKKKENKKENITIQMLNLAMYSTFSYLETMLTNRIV